jgi:hypothetical protein
VSIAAPSGSLRTVQQRASHAHLSQDASLSPCPPVNSRRGRLDALVVPASRPAFSLRPIIELAARLGIPLVVLCSMQTTPEQVAKQVAGTREARCLIIQIPDEWKHSKFPTRTAAEEFRKASAYRVSDLSAKRNLGLLLARLEGWNKIAFVDDDIISLQTDDIARLALKLDDHQVAGMLVRDHPDNSVVCHARRLAGLWQDIFVTGAVLGVHCGDLPLSFFPDLYNEDWFFFAEEAAAHDLPRVGDAKQAHYDPFASPERARREEFGDVLAEGLYALMDEGDGCAPFDNQLRTAEIGYWSRFIQARYEVITETQMVLGGFLERNSDDHGVSSAIASLAAAENQLGQITPDLCVNFLNAWRDDLRDWRTFSNKLSNVRNTLAAMDILELESWTLAEHGAAVVD